MEGQFYNRVWLYGSRANEVIEKLKELEKTGKSKVLEEILKKQGDEIVLFSGDFKFIDSNFFEVDLYDCCINELIKICNYFKVNFKIRYDDFYSTDFGVAIYEWKSNSYKLFDLNKSEIMRVKSESIENNHVHYISIFEDCILEGIEYDYVFEAFDILLERKVKEFKLDFISDAIDHFATSVYKANPICDESMFHYYDWKIVLLKLEELVVKHNAQNYIKVESYVLNEVFKNYHHEDIFDFIKREYAGQIKNALDEYQDYFEGMENSSDVIDRNIYLDILKDVSENILDELHDSAVDDFKDWQIELKLYFLLLTDTNNIIPTKEMFKKYMDNPELFARDIKLDKLLVA